VTKNRERSTEILDRLIRQDLGTIIEREWAVERVRVCDHSKSGSHDGQEDSRPRRTSSHDVAPNYPPET
jgi:hypothetical protein